MRGREGENGKKIGINRTFLRMRNLEGKTIL